MGKRLSHVIGFDDAPFSHAHRGDVALVGAAFAGTRLDGVLVGRVRRDGVNATRRVAELVAGSRFAAHCHAVVLQGIAFAGFNVVDLPGLHRRLGLPVLVVARRQPDLAAIRGALHERVPGGARKWRLIERAGPMEPMAGVHVQRMGIAAGDAEALLRRLAIHGLMPEPLRTAHLIAGALGTVGTRQRV